MKKQSGAVTSLPAFPLSRKAQKAEVQAAKEKWQGRRLLESKKRSLEEEKPMDELDLMMTAPEEADLGDQLMAPLTTSRERHMPANPFKGFIYRGNEAQVATKEQEEEALQSMGLKGLNLEG